MNGLKIMLGLALTMAISGCGLARVYNKVELGHPLPADLGLTEVIKEDAAKEDNAPQERIFGISEYYVWHTPLTTSCQTVAVWTDADDKVIASSYDNCTFTNLLLLILSSQTNTTDILLPAEAVAKPEGMTLFQIMPYYPRQSPSLHTSEAGLKAAMLTAGNMVGYCLAGRHHNTREYVRDIPLSSVLEPGYHETIKVHGGGYVTLTNRGNNRLRIETYVPFVADPACLIMYAVYHFENPDEESKQDDEEPGQPQGGIE